MTPLVRFGLVVACFATLACSTPSLFDSDPIDSMDRHLRELSGRKAFDCGHAAAASRIKPSAESERKIAATTECAEERFAKRSPFYVRWDTQGIDSLVSGGLALDSTGKVYALEFDSMGWSDEGIRPPAYRSKDHHVIVYPCPADGRLRALPNGWTTCLPETSDGQSDIMSP